MERKKRDQFQQNPVKVGRRPKNNQIQIETKNQVRNGMVNRNLCLQTMIFTVRFRDNSSLKTYYAYFLINTFLKRLGGNSGSSVLCVFYGHMNSAPGRRKMPMCSIFANSFVTLFGYFFLPIELVFIYFVEYFSICRYNLKSFYRSV